MYALEAMMGDAVDHERAEKARALKEAEEKSAKQLQAKSRMMRAVAVGAVVAIRTISGALWVWFDGRPTQQQIVSIDDDTIEQIVVRLQKSTVEKLEKATEEGNLRIWQEIPEREQIKIRTQTYVYFPGILTQGIDWESIINWMADEHHVYHKRVSDIFRNTWETRDLPRIYERLKRDIHAVYSEIKIADEARLQKYWKTEIPRSYDERIRLWIELAKPHIYKKLDKQKADEYIEFLESKI